MARKLIDIGVNLTDPMFKGVYRSSRKHHDDFEAMMKRAFDSGVVEMIITGGSLEDSKSAAELASSRTNLFSTVGCHPTRCMEIDNDPCGYLDQLLKLAKNNHEKVVAIGEIGLDYDRLQFCPKDIQKLYFEKQLSLAEQSNLPVFLHNRNSIDDFIEILQRNHHMYKNRSGVVHSFDGSKNDMERVLDLGLYIGINGCSLKTEQNLEVAKCIPSDKLLIETDCPWCEIRPTHASYKYIKSFFKKSKDATDAKLQVKGRNEPMNLVQVLEVLVAVRDEDIDSLAEQIYSNTKALFFNQ